MRGAAGWLVVLLTWWGAHGGAAAAEPTAEELVRRSRNGGGLHLRGAEARIRMVVTRADGARRERRLHSRSREDGGLSRSLVRFISPPDMAGTVYLWIEHRGRPDEHWLYRPELRRARRIAGKRTHQRFMGTDFTYADLEWRDPGERAHRRLADERLAGVPCFVVESRATGADDPYGRVVTWIRKEGYVPLRVKMFSREGRLLKTLFTKRAKKVSGQWVITHARMTSASRGSSTDLFVESIELKKLPATLFDPRRIEKG